ncbi:hypothetical protein ECDEC8C_6242 [Escherichia coli DEC8C]|nr:hypothetical protein ECDEC8C_6242 [Escherichia coli DEC8C]
MFIDRNLSPGKIKKTKTNIYSTHPEPHRVYISAYIADID